MPATSRKPRWHEWEIKCIHAAFHQKIQLKVVAFSLNKSPNAINKKIGSLGLRNHGPSQGQDVHFMLKLSHDVKSMLAILDTFAPQEHRQTIQTALAKTAWAYPQPLVPPTKTQDQPFLAEAAATLCGTPFTYQEKKLKCDEALKGSSVPSHVSLPYVEQWAKAEGFHKVRDALREKGVLFWKEGRYFSRAQILMHMNTQRFENNLSPLYLQSQESDGQDLEKAQEEPAQHVGA